MFKTIYHVVVEYNGGCKHAWTSTRKSYFPWLPPSQKDLKVWQTFSQEFTGKEETPAIMFFKRIR